jgi:hypothetical protein
VKESQNHQQLKLPVVQTTTKMRFPNLKLLQAASLSFEIDQLMNQRLMHKITKEFFFQSKVPTSQPASQSINQG